MPLDGSGTYAPPSGTYAVTSTLVASAPYNAFLDDLAVVLNTSIPVSRGGTGAASAAGARTNLGLEIGVDIPSYNASVNAIAGLVNANNEIMYSTGTQTWAKSTLSTYMRGLLATADLAALTSALNIPDGSTFVLKTSVGTGPDNIVALDGSSRLPAVDASLLTNIPTAPNIIIEHQNSSGNNGGTGSASTWVTRTLNTPLRNNVTGASLASNTLTLPAGTYYAEFRTPFVFTTKSKSRLRNTSDNTTAIVGSSCYANAADNSVGTGLFTIAASKNFTIQSWIEGSPGSYSFGFAASTGEVETYTQLKIWKVS